MTSNKKRRLLEEAKQWISNYLEREHGDTWDVDFDDLTRVRLKYADSEDDITFTLVAVDLVHCCINTYLGDYDDGELIHLRQYPFRNIEELVNALPRLDFEKLALVSDEEYDELDRRLTAAFERSLQTGGKHKMQMKCLEQDWREYVK